MVARFSSFLTRRRAAAPPGAGPAPGDGAQPARVPPPATLRRERRALMRRREEAIRDVGGLALEMYRRDRFRRELLFERCADVLGLEERIHELDALLAAAAGSPRGLRGVTRCKCGAPLPRGVHFCSHCGRPAEGSAPVTACSHCGQPLPAETNFCPSCGNATAAEEFRAQAGGLGEREEGLGAADATIAGRPREEREAP